MTPPHPAGDHKGPPFPASSTLAPTDCPAPRLASRLRLMPFFAGERESRATLFAGERESRATARVRPYNIRGSPPFLRENEKAGRRQGRVRETRATARVRPYNTRRHF